MEDYSNVQVKILEEPAPKALRFRYECEGRSAGSLPGANSTNEKKTFPKIQVQGYKGRAVVVVSCVTVDGPYRPHPHNLVGKEGCKKGVCTLEISNEDMTCEFSNLGIQCVKKKDIEDSLRIREEIRVDPFRTGFGHKTQPGSIDLNSVRLCFQVFLQGPERGQFKIPLKPTVSDPIYDKKAISDLTIMKLSDCSSPVIGNKEIILLCDKVSKDDIEVRFFEENSDGAVVWEAFGDFQPADVHKQYAISFRTPQYHQLEIESPRRVNIQLRCPSKDTTSLPRPFDYIPLHTESHLKRKRIKTNNSSAMADYFNQVLQHQSQNHQQPQSQQQQQQQQQQLTMAQQQPIQVQVHGSNYPLSPQQHHPHSLPSPNYQNMQQHGGYSPNPHAHIQQHPNMGSPGPTHHQQQQQQQQQQNPLGLGMTVIKEEWNWIAPTGTSGGTVVGQTVFSPPPPSSPYHQQQNHNMSPHHNINPNQNPNQNQGGGGGTAIGDLNMNMDNISLPNLSDVNLSLLDNHLSENISGLNLLDDVQHVLGGHNNL